MRDSRDNHRSGNNQHSGCCARASPSSPGGCIYRNPNLKWKRVLATRPGSFFSANIVPGGGVRCRRVRSVCFESVEVLVVGFSRTNDWRAWTRSWREGEKTQKNKENDRTWAQFAAVSPRREPRIFIFALCDLFDVGILLNDRTGINYFPLLSACSWRLVQVKIHGGIFHPVRF